MNTEVRNSESTKFLTHVASSCSVSAVIRFSDIEKRLDQQYSEDAKQLKKNYTEQNKLRPAVIRFRDLEREAATRERRMKRIVMLIGDDKYRDTIESLRQGEDVSKENNCQH